MAELPTESGSGGNGAGLITEGTQEARHTDILSHIF